MPSKLRGKRYSFQNQILFVFCIVSVLPLIIIGTWSYRNVETIVSSNMEELTEVNLVQTNISMKILFDTYRDLLNQMFIDETILDLADKLNAGQEVEVNRGLLRKELRRYASGNEAIHSITLLTKNGEVAFYDMIATGLEENSWMDTFEMTVEELYQDISSEDGIVVYPTGYTTTFGNRPYYLFHIGIQTLDYRDIDKKNAVILISIDQNVLNSLCKRQMLYENNKRYDARTFLVTEDGRMLACEDQTLCGTKVVDMSRPAAEQKAQYEAYVKENGLLDSPDMSVYTYYDKDMKWTLVNVANQKITADKMSEQWRNISMIVVLSCTALFLLILEASKRMTRSIHQVTDIMKEVEKGQFDVRIPEDKERTVEIDTIASQFNSMIEQIEDSVAMEKELMIKTKDAEITALEAQLNPHFLYNILDTINWMAIEKDEYEISNTINSLAHILRYGIDKSNRIVSIADEMTWLKQYIFLQQTRLKNTFECRIDVDNDVLKYHVHKLLFQPFIENAILHGFEGIKRVHILAIRITQENEKLRIVIEDNGKGMTEELAQRFMNGETVKSKDKNHIGVSNSLNRLKLYYGKEAKAEIASRLGEGTKITIFIPIQR